MRKNLPNYAAFAVLSAAFVFSYWYFDLEKKLGLKPEARPVAKASPAEALAAVGGGPAVASKSLPKPTAQPAPVVAKDVPKAEPPKPAAPSEPFALIALGDDKFFLRVLLSTRGGGVQQVALTQFDDANRMGLTDRDSNGKARPLHLIPGYYRPLPRKIQDEPAYIDLLPSLTEADYRAKKKPEEPKYASLLTRPSYTLLHYQSKDDPARPRGEDGKIRSEDDNYPLATLGERHWKIVDVKQPTDGSPWGVAFETELGAPYFVRIRKTFSLHPKEYDFRMTVDLEPLPGRKEKEGLFRYQIAGPVGLPIEGEWYTSTFRNAYVGFLDGYQTDRREMEDPSSIQIKAGGERVTKGGNTFTYAAIGTQYFASALAVDGDIDPWEYVRPTREQTPADPPGLLGEAGYDRDRLFLYDISFRAVSPALDPSKPIAHHYSVYNGPLKVRQLLQLEGARAVEPAVVERYIDKYKLVTLTDYHSPSAFGRFLSSIYWSDVVIASTNIMHRLLGWLHGILGSWGLSIIVLTLMVKILLVIPSRRQQMITADMQAKIAVVKPDIDAAMAKYKDDFMMQQQARAEIMRRAGVNQFGQLSGCLLMFVQMPILMGLYFCLQESVFFRLEPFGFLKNLAAPDMIGFWGESMPVFTNPDNRFGNFDLIPIIPRSFLYVGPYLNLLPLAAVALFYAQQKLTMPPPMTEMEEQQRKMLKYMLIVSLLVFYKFPAGLSIYFIVGGLWTLVERTLIPKPKPKAVMLLPEKADGDEPPKPRGAVGKFAERMKKRLEEMQQQSEGQRQIRNDDAEPKGPSAAEKAEKRKKKKRK